MLVSAIKISPTHQIFSGEIIAQSYNVLLPAVPPKVKHFHWDIENPDILYISEEDRRREFARVRDEIKRYVEKLFLQIEKGEI